MHQWLSFPRNGSGTCARARPGGFTLIEAMIALAVIGILAAIAYPVYTDYIRRGKRATAQAALLELAGKQQTYLLDRRGYAATTADLGFSAPSEVKNDYSFEVVGVDNAATPPVFTVRATPQTAAMIAKGEPTLTVNQAGVKAPASYWGK